MTKELRSGYTTGACAAAGLTAALKFRLGEKVEEVKLNALDGTILTIPVAEVIGTEKGAAAKVIKFSGDDPDITNGTAVITEFEPLEVGSEWQFVAGVGVGRITKPGLSLPPGEAAINPGPRQMMRRAAAEILGEDAALKVTVSIPGGEELAKRTLNPILGIEGGLSVIGTTGVLRPMSEEAFKNSLAPQIDVAKAAGFETQIFVPGKIGARVAAEWGLPTAAVVQTSNFVGFMLEQAAEKKLEKVLLFGHLGKLAKVAAGVFHTHNRIGDGRMETIAAYGAAEGLASEKVRRVLGAATTEEALAVLEEAGLAAKVCQDLAERAGERARRYVFGAISVGVCIVTLDGKILGVNEEAKKIGEVFGWKYRPKTQINRGTDSEQHQTETK